MDNLRRIWSQVLSTTPDFPNSASFLDLGGDSVKAIRLVYMAKKQGIVLKATDLMRGATLAGIAAALNLTEAASTPRTFIPASTSGASFEQSFAQARLWFLDQLNPNSSWYLTPVAMRLRGSLSIKALEAALGALEQRHETLRTTSVNQDGVGVQVVHPSGGVKLQVLDVDETTLDATLTQHQTSPFDLSAKPAWRVALLRLADDHFVLSTVLHHIISDAWSMDIFWRDLAQLYSAALSGQPEPWLPPLEVQYHDYALWQKQDHQQEKYQKQLQYWTKQLADSTPSEIRTDHPRPRLPSGRAAKIDFSIDVDTDSAVKAFAQAHQTTPFVVLLAAFRAALYRVSGAEDANVVVFTAGRPEPELERLIGFFANTVCVRAKVDAARDSLETLVRDQVHPAVIDAMENQEVPFDRVVSAVLPGHKDLSRNPLAQIAFVMHDLNGPETLQLDGLRAESLTEGLSGLGASTGFDVEVHMLRRGGESCISGLAMYATDLFEPETIQALVDVYKGVLRQGLAQPSKLLAELPLDASSSTITSSGGKQLPYPRDSSVVDVFRQKVASSSPDAVAVVDSASSMTYSQLDAESDKVAAWLRQRHLPSESPVAILSPRSCQTVVGFLGVLKAGLPYIPLDVNSPDGRIQTILSSVPDCKLLLLGDGVQPPKLEGLNVEAIPIATAIEQHQTAEKESPLGDAGKGPSATSLAYIIFTSGSTGKPKGVMLEHRALLRTVVESDVTAHLPPAPRVAHLCNLGFDISVQEVWTTLLNGGTLVCIDYFTTLDSRELETAFLRHNVSVAMMTPTLLKQCLANAPAAIGALDVLFNVGDRFDPRDALEAKRLVKRSVLNAYGPTENAMQSTMYEVRADDKLPNGVPIGRAIANSGAYVMDIHQRPVLPGVLGELVVTGDGLARGYHDPALDLNRFVNVTIDGQQMRAYRTGDRVRCRPVDGQIEFIGRMDFQVKVRGNLVEPAEVETAMLEAHEAVSGGAVVVLQNDDARDASLIGFVSLRSGGEKEQKAQGSDGEDMETLIRDRLKHVLPTYMVPQAIVIMEKLPLNSSGKVDRKQLTELARKTPTAPTTGKGKPAHVAPRNDTEAALCQEYSQLFGVDQISATHDFFDLGGSSLLAMKLAARLSNRFGAHVSVKDVFDHPVLADMAETLLKRAATSEDSSSQDQSEEDHYVNFQLCPGEAFVKSTICPELDPKYQQSVVDVYPATSTQAWFANEPTLGVPRTMDIYFIDMPAGYEPAKLAEACGSTIQTFEMLRTVFVSAEGRYWQVVLDRPDVPVEQVDVEEGGFDAATIGLMEFDKKSPLKLGHPFLRIAVLRDPKGMLRMVLRMSHAIWDGLSLPALLQTLHSHYEGVDVPPPPRYALYMKHLYEMHPKGHEHWGRVLAGSSLTVLEDLRAKRKVGDGGGFLMRIIDVPPEAQAPARITQAAVFTTACAVLVAKETGRDDVVFGNVASGRQFLPTRLQGIFGHLGNTMPVRVQDVRAGEADLKSLALRVQEQYLEGAPYEAMSIRDVKASPGVDWPADADRFGLTVAFQNQGFNPESTINGNRMVLSGFMPYITQRPSTVSGEMMIGLKLADQTTHDLALVAVPEPDGRHYRIGVNADQALCESGELDKWVDQLCETFVHVNAVLSQG
ncbi:uncharacterized protein PgNI_02067 [Pyricularia grisea]|uniref:Carrier domain-containing protein n=1 Tax=Pyricularia grisea TaxID=148305 RepID=A0A6P8BFZ4_PYRGI|nr:uncharacterized protein PgNI_02067 [Pyricularia grisea]TLD15771.1 hypothetical protein PgNI_02067 [Pyricularia grisea]